MTPTLCTTARTRWLVLAGLLSAASVSQGCDLAKDMAASGVAAAVFHPPSDRDTFLFQVALNFEVPELCDRIDARADSQQIGAVRSKRSVCHAILKGERSSGPSEVPWDMATFAGQVRALGYSDADMRQSAHGENEGGTPDYGAYQQLLDSGTFQARVRGGPSYAEPRDRDRRRQANALEFLYQKVAIDKREPALCAKISPNATFTDYGDATALLHSRCYLHLAFNLRDAALCQPLPAAGSFPSINEIYDSRDKCLETVKIYARPSFKGTGMTGRTRSFAPTTSSPACGRSDTRPANCHRSPVRSRRSTGSSCRGSSSAGPSPNAPSSSAARWR